MNGGRAEGGGTPGSLDIATLLRPGFLYSLAGVFGLGLVINLLVWIQGVRPQVTVACLLGTVVPGLGTLVWLVLLERTLHSRGKLFIGALVGGMAIRMVLYGFVLALGAWAGWIDLPVLFVVLFGTHLAYQVAEIVGVRNSRSRQKNRREPAGAAGRAAVLLLVLMSALPVAVKAGPAAALARDLGGSQEGAASAQGDPGSHGHEAGSAGEKGGFDLLHHVADGREIETPVGSVLLPRGWTVLGIDLAPTKHVIWMLIASGLLLVFILVSVRSVGLVPAGAGNFLETVVVFIRDEIARKNIHDHPDRFTPYLCTLFFFILFCNLSGLLPFGATATGNLNVTGALAFLSLLLIQGAGIRQNGIMAHLKALCPIPEGIPLWMLPLYIPVIVAVEVVGIFAKPIALALRLFANMTAGHVVILSLIGLIFILQTHLVIPVSVAFALFIYCLEVFVGFIQAYIFTMLTALFIGLSQHPAH
ncbi:MAG: F0F1 ATP synthase subunit A [Acidobacteriota bacterium]